MKNKIIGKKAELIAKNFLKKKGYKLIKSNWWLKKFGEIDIIAQKEEVFYFIEVKSLVKTKDFTPENNYTNKKRERFHQLVNFYSNKYKIDNFVCCLLAISFDILNKKIRIKMFKNV
jgi:putative endonuclease